MRASSSDPSRLDVVAFAKAAGHLSGTTELAGLTRLTENALSPSDGFPAAIDWSLEGLCTERAGREPEVRLHLVARCTLWLQCQRCLQPLAQPLQVDGLFRFVAGDEEAARLDDESEHEDVLPLPRALKLDDLIEDELILALPIIPRHDTCPQPLVFVGDAIADDTPAAIEPAPHPFAALARLKTGESPR